MAKADAQSSDAEPVESGPSLERIVAFSDGVFAIAMTLLVLNLQIPELHGRDLDAQLRHYLGEQQAVLWGYALSFFVIARYWVIHHRSFRLIRRADSTLMVLNLVLLAVIAVLPYPTGLLGEYGETATATIVYAIAVSLTGLASSAVWHHATRAGLVDQRVTPAYRQVAMARSIAFPVIFLLSVPLALIEPWLAQITWGLSFFLHPLLTRLFGDINDPFGTRSVDRGRRRASG